MATLAPVSDDEPNWALLTSDPLDQQSAHVHWSKIATEIREAGRWTPANAHSVSRLVMLYMVHDRAAREVLEHGAIVKSSKTGVPQYSLHFTAMNTAAAAALQLEAELMLSPRKRGKVALKSAKPGTAKQL
jgi:P27 family predicted phage terminase small subunit